MVGDSCERFCESCQHCVVTSESLSISEIDALALSGAKNCMRLTVDESKGILTKDGWIPRLVTAGVAAIVVGCGSPSTLSSSARSPHTLSPQDILDSTQEFAERVGRQVGIIGVPAKTKYVLGSVNVRIKPHKASAKRSKA